MLILSGDQLYRMDLEELARQHHRERGRHHDRGQGHALRPVSALGVMRVNPDLRIVEFVEKPKDPAVISSLVLGGAARARLSDKSERPLLPGVDGDLPFSGKVMRERWPTIPRRTSGKEVIPGCSPRNA